MDKRHANANSPVGQDGNSGEKWKWKWKLSLFVPVQLGKTIEPGLFDVSTNFLCLFLTVSFLLFIMLSISFFSSASSFYSFVASSPSGRSLIKRPVNAPLQCPPSSSTFLWFLLSTSFLLHPSLFSFFISLRYHNNHPCLCWASVDRFLLRSRLLLSDLIHFIHLFALAGANHWPLSSYPTAAITITTIPTRKR